MIERKDEENEGEDSDSEEMSVFLNNQDIEQWRKELEKEIEKHEKMKKWKKLWMLNKKRRLMS